MSETDSSSIFHIGVLVDDLESSMAKLGDGFGPTSRWRSVSSQSRWRSVSSQSVALAYRNI